MPDYKNPVDRLLTQGEVGWSRKAEWPDYVALHGLAAEHVPELIRMASDAEIYKECNEVEGWATLHARRALGQLRAIEAVSPLLAAMDNFIDYDDFWTEELDRTLAMIGPGAIPALLARLAERKPDEFTRATCASTLENIGKAHPEARDKIVAALTAQLAGHEDDRSGWMVNASIADVLVELMAVESAAVVEAAFAADVVDESLAGGWASARYRLGLGPKPRGNDIRPQWRFVFNPPNPPKRPDPKKLLKGSKSRKRQ